MTTACQSVVTHTHDITALEGQKTASAARLEGSTMTAASNTSARQSADAFSFR
jgi:hypothetical protein